MSSFSPDVPPIPRPDPAEMLARFVPSALRRTPPTARIWRLPRLVLFAVVSAGIWPCRALQVRLRNTMTMQAQQCNLASQLLDKHLPTDEAATMAEAAGGVAVSHAWLNASCVAMLASLALCVYWIAGHHYTHAAFARWWLHAPRPGDQIAWASAGLLSLAYFLLIVQMNRQVVAMQQFVLAINAVGDERVAPMALPEIVWGVRVLPILVGGAFATFGLVWGLPMMLAWSAFAMFARDSAFGFRVALAERLTAISGIDSVVPLKDLCPNVECRSTLPAQAVFCPRCGTPIQPQTMA